jgi:hypothetical protein
LPGKMITGGERRNGCARQDAKPPSAVFCSLFKRLGSRPGRIERSSSHEPLLAVGARIAREDLHCLKPAGPRDVGDAMRVIPVGLVHFLPGSIEIASDRVSGSSHRAAQRVNSVHSTLHGELRFVIRDPRDAGLAGRARLSIGPLRNARATGAFASAQGPVHRNRVQSRDRI